MRKIAGCTCAGNAANRNPNKLNAAPVILLLASYRIRKIAGCACARNAGMVFPTPRVSDPDMHHSMCMMHVSWCMPGSLTSGFLWGRWWGKHSRHSQCMHKPQFCVSGKRPIVGALGLYWVCWVFGLRTGYSLETESHNAIIGNTVYCYDNLQCQQNSHLNDFVSVLYIA